ncbi:MAG: hypothetical protein M3250_07770 [Thermoproteota archaeon]|nr:hypothetical protein [Thermoproteota archaeon]
MRERQGKRNDLNSNNDNNSNNNNNDNNELVPNFSTSESKGKIGSSEKSRYLYR